MKIFTPFAALSALLLLAACGPDSGSGYPNSHLRILDISEGGWQQLKAENGANYRYVVTAGVDNRGFETAITVQDERVVQRDFTLAELDNQGQESVLETWSETGEDLGSHADTGAAEPVTVDDRYTTCKTEVNRSDINMFDVDIAYIAPMAQPERTFVLSHCLVLPKDVIYDGGSETLTTLEFFPRAE